MSKTVVKNKAFLKLECRVSDSIPIEGQPNKNISGYQIICFGNANQDVSKGVKGYLNVMSEGKDGKLEEVSKNGGIPIRFFPNKKGAPMTLQFIERGMKGESENYISIGSLKVSQDKNDDKAYTSGALISCEQGKAFSNRYLELAKDVSVLLGKTYVSKSEVEEFSEGYASYNREVKEAYENTKLKVEVDIVYGHEHLLPNELITDNDIKYSRKAAKESKSDVESTPRPLAKNYNDKYNEYYLDSLYWIKNSSDNKNFEADAIKFINSSIEFRLDFLMRGKKDIDTVVAISSKEIKELITDEKFIEDFGFIDVQNLRKVFADKINSFKKDTSIQNSIK